MTKVFSHCLILGNEQVTSLAKVMASKKVIFTRAKSAAMIFFVLITNFQKNFRKIS